MSTPQPDNQYQQPAPQVVYVEKKKKGGCMKFILGAIGVIVLIVIGSSLAGGNSTSGSSTSGSTAETKAGNVITYQVESTTGSVESVSYVSPGGNIGQDQGAATPWSKEVTVDSKWDAFGVNMNAQNSGDGSVTCRILWNGEVNSESTSTGAYAVASCSFDMDKAK